MCGRRMKHNVDHLGTADKTVKQPKFGKEEGRNNSTSAPYPPSQESRDVLLYILTRRLNSSLGYMVNSQTQCIDS